MKLSLKARVTALAAALAVGGGVGMATAPAALAHHNYEISAYVSTSSVSRVTFGDYRGGSWVIDQGRTLCCFVRLGVWVGSAHDILVSSREYPTFYHRISAYGWQELPDLAGGSKPASHLTVRVVPNGGA